MTAESPETPVDDTPIFVDPAVYPLRLALSIAAKRKPDEKLHAAEVGVYRGRGLQAFLAETLDLNVSLEWIGIDTFSGLPPLSKKDLELAPENAPFLVRPAFQDTTKREVDAFLAPLGMEDRYTLIEGRFKDVAKDLKPSKYVFVNIALKTYEGNIDALKYFYKRIRPRGVISLEDYFNRRFPMAMQAIDDFLSDKPEEILQIIAPDEEGKPNKRAFIVKL